MPPVLVLAHAPHAEAIAHRIKEAERARLRCAARGSGDKTRGQAAKIETAHKVVLLWSRAARGTPALRATGR